MNADLTPVISALAQLNDGELTALIDATNGVPQIAPGLLAWVEHICEWELNRRGGSDFPLQPPDAAIDPSEDTVSIAAAVILRAQFAQDDRKEARGVAVLLDAMIGVLSGGERRH
jgi:hypothetical protein